MNSTDNLSARENEHAFRNIVEIPVPNGGLGPTLNEMLDWHARRGIDVRRGTLRRDGIRYFVRWCFAKRSDANSFKKRFQGRSALAPE